MPKRIGVKTKKEDKKLTKTEAKEFIKCVNDVKYFIENYVYVQHPTKGAIKFELRSYQEKVLNGLLGFDKNIILQPRQSGKCCFYDTKITIRNKKTGLIETISIGDFYERCKNNS